MLVATLSARFTSRLSSWVVDSVADTRAFVAATTAGLEEELAVGEDGAPTQEALKHVMGVIRDVSGGIEEGCSGGGGSGEGRALRPLGTHRSPVHTPAPQVRRTRYVRRALVGPLRAASALLKRHGVVVEDLRLPMGAAGAAAGEAPVALLEALEGIELAMDAVINKTFLRKVSPWGSREWGRPGEAERKPWRGL